MTIESRGALYAALTCGGCGRRFEANVYSVPNFRGAPACQPCMDQLNGLRDRLGINRWTYPENTYPTTPPVRLPSLP